MISNGAELFLPRRDDLRAFFRAAAVGGGELAAGPGDAGGVQPEVGQEFVAGAV